MEEQSTVEAPPPSSSYSSSPSIAALAAALAKAQGSIQLASKARENPHFKSRYADLASVWEACREALSVNQLAVLQPTSTGPDGGITVTTLLVHASGEWLRSELTVRPAKLDPQALGSAMTYLRRYGLSAMVGVAPADDDDGEAAEDRGPGPTASWSERALKGSQPQRASRPEPEPDVAPPGRRPPPHQYGVGTPRERDEMIAANDRSRAEKAKAAQPEADPHGAMPDAGRLEAIRMGKLFDRLVADVLERIAPFEVLEDRFQRLMLDVKAAKEEKVIADKADIDHLRQLALNVKLAFEKWQQQALDAAAPQPGADG